MVNMHVNSSNYQEDSNLSQWHSESTGTANTTIGEEINTSRVRTQSAESRVTENYRAEVHFPFNPTYVNQDPGVIAPDVDFSGISLKNITYRRLKNFFFSFCVLVVLFVAAFVVNQVDSRFWWLWILPLGVFLLAVWNHFLIPRRVKAVGFARLEDEFLMCAGIFNRKLHIVPYGRMQYVDVTQSLLQRYFKLATLTIHTASSNLSSISLVGITLEQAQIIRKELTELGQEKMAGI